MEKLVEYHKRQANLHEPVPDQATEVADNLQRVATPAPVVPPQDRDAGVNIPIRSREGGRGLRANPAPSMRMKDFALIVYALF